MEKAKNPIKIGFLKVVIQNCEKSNKWILSKNSLTLFVPGREKKTRILVHTICFGQTLFGPKQCKAGSTIKIWGFSGNCKKAKMTPFLGKRWFLTWLKKWVLLTVFLKSCVSWKHYFYCVFSKTQLFKMQNCLLKKQKIYEK